MSENLYRSKSRKPVWSELIRMAGDRAAILCCDLRSRVGEWEDVREDLHYFGPDWGWAPRYRVGGTTLCVIHLLPGKVEVTLPIRKAAESRLLASRQLSVGLKRAIRMTPSHRNKNNEKNIRVPLRSAAAVDSVARVLDLQHNR